MRYHIALSRPFDLETIEAAAAEGKRPRHLIWTLSQELQAVVHQPDYDAILPVDTLGANLCSQPDHWALARQLATELTGEDLVFCAGEDVGLPLALQCRRKADPPRLAVSIMAPDRLRVRALLKVFRLADRIQLFITNTRLKVNSLRQHLNLPEEQVYQLSEQTDTQFFYPGPISLPKTQPLIFSAGLEQRDYKTLAAATADLDLEVKVCALSPNASRNTRVAYPDPVPANMTFQPYDWLDFRQLYWDADLVVISLLDNPYSAGLTSLMEAMACCRPAIITRTPGVAEALIDQGYVVGVRPGDVADLRQAILNILQNPQAAMERARRAYQLILREHTSEKYVADLAQQLMQLDTVLGIDRSPPIEVVS